MNIEESNIANLPTTHGNFQIQSFKEQHKEHLVIFSNNLGDVVNVRVHSECLTGDAIGSLKCDCQAQLNFSLDYINKNSGMVIYLRQEGRNIGLLNKVNAYALQDKGFNTIEANHQLGFQADERTYEIVEYILNKFNIKKINLITNNPHKIESLPNIEIIKRIPVVVGANENNKDYLKVKKRRNGAFTIVKINNLEELNLGEDFLPKCEEFKKTLQHWGKVHNLSAELEDEKIEKNIYDSIYVLKFIKDYKTVADIGTGAGYPGLILAMARPNIKFYLIEPRAKRVAFLNFIKNSLKLDNIEILCNRVEYVKDIKVDLITSRAVTNTSLLLDLTKDISTESTSYLFYKGSMLESELEEAKIHNYEIIKKDEKRNYLYINKGNK